MEAGFCYCDYDYESPEFFRVRDVRAHKVHQCCECSEPIKPGDTYEYIIGKWDGELSEYRTCLTCSRIRTDFCAAFTTLRHTLWEGLGVDYLGEWDDDD